MKTVTISPTYRVVIPREIRQQLGLVPGQKLQASPLGGCIEFVPVQRIDELRGFLKGIDTHVRRR